MVKIAIHGHKYIPSHTVHTKVVSKRRRVPHSTGNFKRRRTRGKDTTEKVWLQNVSILVRVCYEN